MKRLCYHLLRLPFFVWSHPVPLGAVVIMVWSSWHVYQLAHNSGYHGPAMSPALQAAVVDISAWFAVASSALGMLLGWLFTDLDRRFSRWLYVSAMTSRRRQAEKFLPKNDPRQNLPI